MKWGDKRYNSLNCFLREKFAGKVFKISLDGGFSCPNRDGKVSFGGCIFCSERGSGDFAGHKQLSVKKQFEEMKPMMNKKWKDGKLIAYFQAYTNTYAPVEVLREKYEEAIAQEGVVALAIATRPDCLEKEVIDLIQNLNEKRYTWVELGLQTSNENTAKIINRGYKIDVYNKAVEELRKKNIDVVTHVILGLPGETEEDMLNTIKYLAKQDIQGIKLHLLHLMKDTPLVKLYEKGELSFMSQEQYVSLICKALELLPPEMVIHRLTGDAPRELLIEPQWSLKKWEVLNSIDRTLEEKNTFQGRLFNCKD